MCDKVLLNAVNVDLLQLRLLSLGWKKFDVYLLTGLDKFNKFLLWTGKYFCEPGAGARTELCFEWWRGLFLKYETFYLLLSVFISLTVKTCYGLVMIGKSNQGF